MQSPRRLGRRPDAENVVGLDALDDFEGSESFQQNRCEGRHIDIDPQARASERLASKRKVRKYRQVTGQPDRMVVRLSAHGLF